MNTFGYVQYNLSLSDLGDKALHGPWGAPGQVEVPHCHLANVVPGDHVSPPVNKVQGGPVHALQKKYFIWQL